MCLRRLCVLPLPPPTRAGLKRTHAARQLGLETLIDVIVTSGEVGQDKPGPLIFLAALDRTGVTASETVHVGDQYGVDVVGARAVGIAPLLLDRYDFSTEITDCPRIRSLAEVAGYLG